MHYVAICVLLVSLTACLGETFEETLLEQFQDVSSECQEALTTCALPLVLPYVTVSDLNDFLERVSNIRLGEHCRKTRKSFNCFRGLIGQDQCSEIEPIIVKAWKVVTEPILDDIWTYICRTEFKKFNIHYRCLLTEDVINGLHETCASVTGPSDAVACFGVVIKEECGSTASEIARNLLASLIKRAEDIQKELERDQHGDDDDDEQDIQSTLPDNVYSRQLTMLKKILKRK